MPANIRDDPRPWGGGNHLCQTDMDDLEIRKVRALERIADALDGGKTSMYSGQTVEHTNASITQAVASKSSNRGSGVKSLFDCFH